MKTITNNFKSLLIILLMSVIGMSTSYAAKIQTDTLKVSGNCGMCEKRIISAVTVKGVKNAQWDVETQMLTIKYDTEKIQIEDIEKRISKVGHDTPNFKADEETYKNLHHCCQYTR